MTGDVDPVESATGGWIKSVRKVEHRQLIYEDVLFDASVELK